jgi:staphyloferrin A synthase
VIEGHPVHPLCRTRMGLSVTENRAYAPEFRPVIELGVVDVPLDRWISGGSGLPPRLPIHPWQRDHVLDRYPGLRPTAETIRARPLMSLRTVALADRPHWHLKTSVDVQMTSAVRIVSPAAIHNGPLMSALLAQLCRDEQLTILAEVAAGAVRSEPGGDPVRSLAVVQRTAPRLAPGEAAVPFAALSAPDPDTGRALLTGFVDDPAADFERLIGLMLPPLLRLLHRGVALEAHGQNLLVIVRDRVPVRLAYRDMGGVRVHAGRLHRYADPPVLHGDLATDDVDELRTKLLAAAVSTVVGQLIATMTAEYGTDPADLWHRVAAVVHRTYSELPRDAQADRAAILGATLPIKATTAMRLAARPLEDIWAPIRNPMAGR